MLKSIKLKLLALAILPVLITVISTTVVTVQLTIKNAEQTLNDFEKAVIAEKKELLKNEILTLSTIIGGIIKDSENIQEAKRRVINLASNARFLGGSGYFFAYENKGSNYHFAFHGTKPHLNGKKTDIYKPDIKGFSFRKALIDSGRDDNKFIEYHYKKPNTDKIIKKMAFAKYIPELNWTIVTGIYVDDIEKKLAKVQKMSDENKDSLIITMISIILVILVLLTIIVSYISKISIIEPLKVFEDGLLSFLKFLNRETSTATLIEATTKDEIGKMTEEINENIVKIKHSIEEDNEVIKNVSKVVSEVSSGILTNRVTARTTNNTINELTQNLNKMIEQLHFRIEHSLEVLNKYQQRDFRAKTSASANGEIQNLMNGINSLGDEISQMLKNNLENGTTLNQNADTLNINVERLTTSANQQASNLEETAASLEEITATMRQNASNMNNLSSYASKLSTSVQKGQELTNQTTKSMEEINEQVTAIHESITVIDQIAFQTNILSLNAAVEAATAGESGKGFAVVAGEVRNLASRSAEAAKEIKDLVENATLGANSGKEIAKQMFDGYEGLNDNIEHTTKIIESVTMNSKEQMSGLEQINQAVSELDQATQENASIATKTNDIARATNEMATHIVDEANKNEFIGK